MKKKLLILAVIMVLLLVGTLVFVFMNKGKSSNFAPAQQKFTENFVRDFSNYSYGNLPEYNNRINNYIFEGFLEEFKESNNLVLTDGIEKNNYSKLLSIDNINKSNVDESVWVFEVDYTVEVLDRPGLEVPTNLRKQIIITVKEVENENYITAFSYGGI